MGDMADFAIDCAFNDLENYDKYRDSPLGVQYENGLVDEHGFTIGNPSSIPAIQAAQRAYRAKTNPVGPGECPKCGGDTRPIEGKFGRFYGCIDFPKCKGSRNA